MNWTICSDKKNNQTKIKPNNKCVCALVWGAKLVEPKHFRAYFITSTILMMPISFKVFT